MFLKNEIQFYFVLFVFNASSKEVTYVIFKLPCGKYNSDEVYNIKLIMRLICSDKSLLLLSPSISYVVISVLGFLKLFATYLSKENLIERKDFVSISEFKATHVKNISKFLKYYLNERLQMN